MAAGHVAGGPAEKLTPPYDKARGAASRSWNTTRDTFNPLYQQMREGAANARREQEMSRKNRWPVLVGLLAAGAAVGAAGAMVARRRRAAAEWEDYDPMRSIDDAYHSVEPKLTSTQKVTAGAATMADSVSAQAGKIADSLHEKSTPPSSSPSSTSPSSTSPSSTSSSPSPPSKSSPTTSGTAQSQPERRKSP
jgi:hypothetical protein